MAEEYELEMTQQSLYTTIGERETLDDELSAANGECHTSIVCSSRRRHTRFDCDWSSDVCSSDLGKVSDARKAAEEARQLGKWLQETGLAKLRAETWRDVAVLCPRKEWLQTLRRGLRAAGLNVQIQSEKELKGDSPAYAWLTALLIVLSQPRCGYEIAGLLRELFGISDHDLAVFSQGYGDRFQIETLTTGADVVSEKLSLLAQIRWSILPLPLFDAVSEVVSRTQLRGRLNALPRADFENVDG